MSYKKLLAILLCIIIIISLARSNFSYRSDIKNKSKTQVNTEEKGIDNNDKISDENTPGVKAGDNQAKGDEGLDLNDDKIIELEDHEAHEVHEGQGKTEDVERASGDKEDFEEVPIYEFRIDKLQLREGIANEDVLRLIRFLNIKGFDLEESYYFNSQLKEAVKKYQRENGLEADGIVGAKTLSRINQDMRERLISIPYIELSLPEPVPVGDWLLVNKESNTLYHYKNKELVRSYPVATGKLPELTPEGKFTIIIKFVNPYWGGAGRYDPVEGGAPNNPLGKRWMGLNIKGGRVYGIHGNANFDSIGKYITLGCIRMFNDDVEYLFDLIDYNTPVWIYSSLPEAPTEIVVKGDRAKETGTLNAAEGGEEGEEGNNIKEVERFKDGNLYRILMLEYRKYITED
ncbi:MAG: L,D-transpeptidase family protein [Tissierellia bacterium]|nr:L,D-transpeptidase family protein [Tissierellia bacterium]